MTKFIMQCAGSKDLDAGTLHTQDGKAVVFVARPEKTPTSSDYYAHPDDLSDDGIKTWREKLVKYNEHYKATGKNPDNLSQAYKLYRNPAYKCLACKFGVKSFYILSAGWGLVRADFLIPTYDITFSTAKNVLPYARRSNKSKYKDLNQLPDDGGKTIFVGGKNYRNFLCDIIENYKGEKIIFYKSKDVPNLHSSFEVRLYKTDLSTNWQYECAHAIANGTIKI